MVVSDWPDTGAPGDATESEDCVNREDEHGRVMTRLCKNTRGRERYVGDSG